MIIREPRLSQQLSMGHLGLDPPVQRRTALLGGNHRLQKFDELTSFLLETPGPIILHQPGMLHLRRIAPGTSGKHVSQRQPARRMRKKEKQRKRKSFHFAHNFIKPARFPAIKGFVVGA